MVRDTPMATDRKRLIEVSLVLKAMSKQPERENPLRRGHISTRHKTEDRQRGL